VPLSGGLDSRVIAGLISRRRSIDLSYTQFELPYPIKIAKNIESVTYSRQIAKALNIKQYYSINVNKDSKADRDAVKGLPMESTLRKSKMYTGLRKLNEFIDTKEYTFVTGHGLDVLTGVGVTPLTLLFGNPYLKDLEARQKKIDYFNGVFDGTYGKFGKWSCPLWSDEVEQFCMDLKLSDRYLQRLYRQMITKYFPELAKINREEIHCPVNASELKYFMARTVYFLKKLQRSKQ